MLLNRAEVDAGVIPSARARVLALSSYIINDNSFFGLARYMYILWDEYLLQRIHPLQDNQSLGNRRPQIKPLPQAGAQESTS